MIWRCSLNKVADTYWIDSRLAAQRPAVRGVTFTPARSTVGAYTRDTAGARTIEAHRGGRFSMAVFSMVILAMFAICITVTLRTQAHMQTAAKQHEMISVDVEALRNSNAALEQHVRRLRTDPRAIEMAARERLGMVRHNEIIVPVQ